MTRVAGTAFGLAGTAFGIVGALRTCPFRLARREVERQGGTLHRGAGRRAAVVVFGRMRLARPDRAAIEAAVDAVTGAGLAKLSESGFLRRLGHESVDAEGIHDREAMIAMSGLSPRSFDCLALYDAFERDAAPFTFRDLILARKYRDLEPRGADWLAIARAVHSVPERGALAALDLDVEARAIIARRGAWTGEIDGQGVLDLADAAPEADTAFEAAEAAEAAGDLDAAAGLYNRCLGLDPGDGVAAFNRANCLRDLGRAAEAAHDYARAVKCDPDFAEAWFNLAGVMAAAGHPAPARRHLERALAIDPGYADAVFNLARLDHDAGRFREAEALWRRYLQLDGSSEWAQRARSALRLIAMQRRPAGTGP